MAGGVPVEISTIGVCDGIAMNHDGMHYSLVSRETIADSFEIAMHGHQFDAAVCIPNCDKIVPGMILGALRVNVPTVFVSGGPMLPGHQRGRNDGPTTDLNSLFDGVGKVQAGTMSEDDLTYLENSACPTCGSCSGMFTANSMNCLCEALGIALPGNGTIPAVYSERLRLAKHAGMKVMELLEKGVCIKDIITPAAIHNAMECDMAFGGSTNTVLHLTAIAMEAGCPITMDDWDAASARTPHLVKLQPSGPRPLIDLYAVGGVPVVMHELAELGLLDTSALTCMGLIPEYLERCGRPADGEVVRTHDNPFSKVGALRVLHGNIAPDGGIVKKAAVDPSMMTHTGPARCFDSEEEAEEAILAGKAPKKKEFTEAVLWEVEECKRRGIEIKTGTTVTPELIAEVKPDHVIVATGAHYVMPNIPGLEGNENVVFAEDVLTGKVEPKGEVVVLGGGGTGCETAQYLIDKGIKDVRVMDTKRVGNGMGMRQLRRYPCAPALHRR